MARKYVICRNITGFLLILQSVLFAAPTVESLQPGTESTEVDTNTALTITFSEDVEVGTGEIRIMRSNDRSDFETIDVAGPNVLMDSVIADFETQIDSFVLRDTAVWTQDKSDGVWTDEQSFGGIGAVATVLGTNDEFDWVATNNPEIQSADWSSYDSLSIWVYTEQACSISIQVEWNVFPGKMVSEGIWTRLSAGLDRVGNSAAIREFGIRKNNRYIGNCVH